jgi:O-antigen/teichoic acid export membrane protein
MSVEQREPQRRRFGLPRAGRTLSALAASGSGALLLANIWTAVMGVITSVITVRALGPAGRGDMVIVSYWSGFILSVIDLSILELSTMRVAGNPRLVRRFLWEAMALVGLCSALGMPLGWVAMPHVLTADQQHMVGAARAYLVYIPAALAAVVPQGCLLGLQRFTAVARVRASSTVLYAVMLVTVVLLRKATAVSIAWLGVVSMVVQFVLALFALLPDLRGAARAPMEQKGVTEAARQGARLQSARIASVLGANVDRALANVTLTQAGIGTYQVPAMVGWVLPVVPQAIAQHALSRLSSADGADRAEVLVRSYVRAVGLTLLAALGGASVFWLLIPLVYGPDFESAVVPSVIMAASVVPNAGALVLASGFKASGRVGPCVESEVLAILITLATGVGIAPRLGMVGLGISIVAGRLVSLLWLVFRADSLLGRQRWHLLFWSNGLSRAVNADRVLLSSLSRRAVERPKV